MEIVHQIVDRCHVGETPRAVIRTVIGRVRGGYRTWHALPRSERRAILKAAVDRHRQNQRLYRLVMSGRLG